MFHDHSQDNWLFSSERRLDRSEEKKPYLPLIEELGHFSTQADLIAHAEKIELTNLDLALAARAVSGEIEDMFRWTGRDTNNEKEWGPAYTAYLTDDFHQNDGYWAHLRAEARLAQKEAILQQNAQMLSEMLEGVRIDANIRKLFGQ